MWRWWCVSVRRYDYSFETSCEDVLSMKCILLRCDAFYIYIYIYIYIYKKCSDFTEKSAVWIPCFLDPCYTECRKNQFIFYLPLIFFHLILVFFYPVFQNSRPIFCRPNGNILNQFHPRPPPSDAHLSVWSCNYLWEVSETASHFKIMECMNCL